MFQRRETLSGKVRMLNFLTKNINNVFTPDRIKLQQNSAEFSRKKMPGVTLVFESRIQMVFFADLSAKREFFCMGNVCMHAMMC